MKPRILLIGTLCYVFASFLVQFVSHFAINASHYAGISFMRTEPLMFLGVLTMILQGLILTIIYVTWAKGNYSIRNGVLFAWLVGAFFVAYPALVEADKYAVENIGQWIWVEASAGFVQFTIFGLFLGRFIQPKPEHHGI